MKLINAKVQLIENIETFENYLVDGSANEKSFINDLIRKGKCLVAYEIEKELRFAPSRFLGYINNDVNKHSKSREKRIIDGRETNPEITRVLKTPLLKSIELEKKYLTYCKSLGLAPSNYKNRRYWFLKLDHDFIENKESNEGFPEGKIVERIHKSRERNSKVIDLAKENFKRKYGKLVCQICKFDFEKKYGAIGHDIIEGHHVIPVSEMKDGHITSPDEIALLCANCHRMVHIKRPWLSMAKLKSILK
jgi:hypothetical protein